MKKLMTLTIAIVCSVGALIIAGAALFLSSGPAGATEYTRENLALTRVGRNADYVQTYCTEGAQSLQYHMEVIHGIPEDWGPWAAERDWLYSRYPKDTPIGHAIRQAYQYAEQQRWVWACEKIQEENISPDRFEIAYLSKLARVWHANNVATIASQKGGEEALVQGALENAEWWRDEVRQYAKEFLAVYSDRDLRSLHERYGPPPGTEPLEIIALGAALLEP